MIAFGNNKNQKKIAPEKSTFINNWALPSYKIIYYTTIKYKLHVHVSFLLMASIKIHVCKPITKSLMPTQTKLKILLNVNKIHSLKITSKSMECM